MSTDVWVDPAIIPWPSVWFYQMSALQKCGGYLELEFHRLWTVNQMDGSQGRKCFQKILQILFEFQDQNTAFLSYEDIESIESLQQKWYSIFSNQGPGLSLQMHPYGFLCVFVIFLDLTADISVAFNSHTANNLLKNVWTLLQAWKPLIWNTTCEKTRPTHFILFNCSDAKPELGAERRWWAADRFCERKKKKKKLNWIWASAHLPDRKTRPCEKRVLSVKRLLYKLLLSCRNTGSVIPFLLR